MGNDIEKILSSVPLYNLNDYTIVVFGAGNTSLLYQKCFEREGINPVYYIDNSEAKQETVFQGVSVISVEKLISVRKNFSKPLLVLICSAQITACNQIKEQLQKYGLIYITVDAFVFKKNTDMIKTVYNYLADNFSKEVYIQLIQSRVNNSPVPEFIVSNEQYFSLPQFLKRSEKEVFVDLGAYVGDTVEEYISKKLRVFGKIYAFEPDTVNFTALQHRSARLKNEWAFSNDKLALINGGVGSKSERMYLSSSSMSNVEGSNSSTRLGAILASDKTSGAEVMVYALDDYFHEQKVSFIKADIESFELDMLQGAETVIKRDRPLLTICIYHNASDMFTIPLLIRELCNDYTLKVRHHTYDYAETVLYAYI